jgi:predicted DNA-binding transcriptional regulator YafY
MDRLFTLVLQLQAHGMRRACDLASDCNVSLRTVYRDVQALCEAGVPVVSLPGQGYALTEGYFLPPLMFTGLEAGTLALGAEHMARTLGAPFRDAAESALAKLSNALTAESRHEWRQVQEALGMAQVENLPEHQHLHDLRDAIVGRQALRIHYRTLGRPAAEDLTIEPYGIVYFGRTWQLLAYCRRREGPRLFHLDRVDAVERLADRFSHLVPAPECDLSLPGPDARLEVQ